MWNGKIKGWSGFGAPRGLYEGKPRLEITDWKAETPSALDFARGISSRWTVTTWHGGVYQADGKLPRLGGMLYPNNLYFAWKREGKWHQTPLRYGAPEFDVKIFGVRTNPTSNKVHLGLPLDLVPKDANEVRLRGRMEGWMARQAGTVHFSSAPIDVSLKAPGEKWPEFAGSRVSPLKLVEAEQNWNPPLSKRTPNTAYWEVAGVFSYSGEATKKNIDDAQSWVEDAKGKRVKDVSSNSWGNFREGIGSPIWTVNTSKLNPKNGPFTLKSWVYLDKEEWPLRVSIPLTVGKPSKRVG